MSLSTLVFAYLLGGVTFLPLLVLSIGYLAWITLPSAVDKDATQDEKAVQEKEQRAVEALEAAKDDRSPADAAAGSTFAVLRSYNFQAALTILNAKKDVGAGGNADGSVDAAGGESMSVYQSMYRSVFDRNRNAASTHRLAEEDEAASDAGGRARGKPPAGKLFYVVLRHGHLMLYDSPAQLEVRHVVSLAHHTISLSDGEAFDEGLPEAELFIKRTAIVFEPLRFSQGVSTPTRSHPVQKPFYLFSNTCSDMEDFYHALLFAQSQPPVPQPIDPECAIKLQSTLHSNLLTPEMRAFNAVIGRVFLALHRTPFMEKVIRDKIEKKMKRVQKPSFISSLALQSIELGESAPVLSNPRLRDLHISGEMVISLDVRYTGGLKVVIAALAKLDLGPRFKVRTVDLLLAGSIQRFQGKMLVRIKPPPSSRIWFCFEGLPDMEIKIEPVVSSRQITYTFILRAIENRIREVVAETLVHPNWDDIPFFQTGNQTFRGGIWKFEPESKPQARGPPSNEDMESEDDEPGRAASGLGMLGDKTMSMPVLPSDADVASVSSGSQPSGFMDLDAGARSKIKRRSVASLPPHHAAQSAADRAFNERASTVPKPIRSPSFTSLSASAPVVALDGSNVDAVRGDDASASTRGTKRWIGLGSQAATKRDAVETIREVRERSLREELSAPGSPAQHSASDTDLGTAEDDDHGPLSTEPDDLESDHASGEQRRRASDSTSTSAYRGRGVSPQQHTPASRTNSTISSSSRSSGQGAAQPKNLLAATAAATIAARQWTWNAVASRKTGPIALRDRSGRPEGAGKEHEPMGRGQPLPPPGTPLPGPKNRLWNVAASGLGGAGMKRKPVLPSRQPTERSTVHEGERRLGDGEDVTGQAATRKTSTDSRIEDHSDGQRVEEGDGEFGPWYQNEQAHVDAQAASESHVEPVRPASHKAEHATTEHLEGRRKSAAPPLPPRRRKIVKDDESIAANDVRSESQDVVVGKEAETHFPHDGSSHDKEDDDVIAIPAPVDSDAEENGSLALEEADGEHILRADTTTELVKEEVPDDNGEAHTRLEHTSESP